MIDNAIFVEKLTKDIKKETYKLSKIQAKYFVKQYYAYQDMRIATGNQIFSSDKMNEANEVLQWFNRNQLSFERQMYRILETYAQNSRVGRWLLSIKGIGPIITAGLLSNLDITRASCPSSFAKYAGLCKDQGRKKGEKIDYDIDLKRLCFLIGESFVKCGKGQIYQEQYKRRKEFELEKNEKLGYKEQSELILAKKKFSKDTVAYKAYLEGKLPDAHIHMRAKRYAVKLFLYHVFYVMYLDYYKEKPPRHYVFSHLEHVHEIPPQNLEVYLLDNEPT